MGTAMERRGRAIHCCKALLFVAAAAAAWGCIIPARTATTLSIFVALISINMAGLAARGGAPLASSRRGEELFFESGRPSAPPAPLSPPARLLTETPPRHHTR